MKYLPIALIVPLLVATAVGAEAQPEKNHGLFCTGDLLLDQEPDLIFGSKSEANCDSCIQDSQAQAENFAVDNDTLVSEIVVWGFYPEGVAPPAIETWTVIFHEDGPGAEPGPQIAAETVTAVSRLATGREIDVLNIQTPEMRWLLRLENPVRLEGGRTYWIQPFHDSPIEEADVSIETAFQDPMHSVPGRAFAHITPGQAPWIQSPGRLALQICGVDARWDALLIPRYEIDLNDPSDTTLFGVRNTSGQVTEVEVAYYENLGDGPLRTDLFQLGPQETLTRDVGVNTFGLDPDNDGTATGFVLISESDGGTENLTGDFSRVDFSNDFATGERMLRFSDFCTRQDVRFVDFGSGTEFNVVLRNPPDSGAAATVRIFNEAGALLDQVELENLENVNRIAISELIAGQSFGTLEWDFSASAGGVVTGKYSAFGRFSTEVSGSCRE